MKFSILVYRKSQRIPFFYAPPPRKIGRHIVYCCQSVHLSVCPSVDNLTCKLNISLLLQIYLSYNHHIWHEAYFQDFEPMRVMSESQGC